MPLDEHPALRGQATTDAELARCEEEQRYALQLLHTMTDSAPHAIIGVDANGSVRLWNSVASQVFHVGLPDVIGRRVADLKPAAAAELTGLVARALAGERATGIPACLPRAGGEPAEFSVSLAPLRGDDGRVVGGVVTWADVTVRRGAERELAETSRVLRGIVDAAPVGIATLDPDGNVRLWSRGAEEMFGWTAAELVGKRIPTIPEGAENERFRAILESAIRGKALRNHEVRRRRKDGAALIVNLSTAPLRDAEGHVEAIVGVMVDVTEQRSAELARARLAAIVESSTDAIIGYDLDGTIDTWNPGAEHVYGYTRAEGIGRNFSMLNSPERRGECERILEYLKSGRSYVAEETERVRKDGSVVRISLTVWPLRDATGRVVGGSSFARDVSELRRRVAEREAEAGRTQTVAIVSRALAATRLDVQETMDAIATAVAEHVSDACVVWSAGPGATPRAFASHTRAGAALEGRDEGGDAPIQEVMRHGETVRCGGVADRVLCPIHALGRTLGVLDATRAPAAGSFAPGDVALLEDLAERAGWAIEHAHLYESTVRAQERADDAGRRLRHLNRELDARVEDRTRDLRAMLEEVEALSYVMSHELRQPLRSIDGFAASVLAHDGEGLSEEARADLGRIRAAVGRLDRLVEDLLSVARAVRPHLEMETVDLSALARLVGEQLAASHPRRRVELDVAPGMHARGDAALLRLVLENLLSNAWKFTEGRAVAHVAVGQATLRSGEAAWFVRDDGIGFDMRWADQLFRPLRQLNAPTAFAGSGIGLATVRRIIRRHGGRCWAQGVPGQGATFWFTLWTEVPAARTEASPSEE